MISKIFLSVLLLTCVYTYMLKSIKDNNDTIFQKYQDNLNFELNGIQRVKPNLKVVQTKTLREFLLTLFGNNFWYQINKYKINYKTQYDLFNNNHTYAKVNAVKNPEELYKFFDDEMFKKLNFDQGGVMY